MFIEVLANLHLLPSGFKRTKRFNDTGSRRRSGNPVLFRLDSRVWNIFFACDLTRTGSAVRANSRTTERGDRTGLRPHSCNVPASGIRPNMDFWPGEYHFAMASSVSVAVSGQEQPFT